MSADWKWKDRLGNEYVFEVNDWNSRWNDVPGIYIAVAVDQFGSKIARYVGKAVSFSSRLTPAHEGLACAKQRGATEIHAMIVRSTAECDRIEKLLIDALDPICNTQHRTDR